MCNSGPIVWAALYFTVRALTCTYNMLGYKITLVKFRFMGRFRVGSYYPVIVINIINTQNVLQNNVLSEVTGS